MVEAHHYLFTYSDPSVGLYLYVAELWLHGHLPYLTAWEFKPPGLFGYYALALTATGERATLAVALLVTLSTFANAVLLWRLAPIVDRTGGGRSGRYAALFSVLLATENDGSLGDAEVLLAPFLTGALLLACGEDVSFATAAASGLLAGCALQMKLSVVPIVFFFALVAARRARQPLRLIAAYALAAVMPFAIEAAVYARAGALDALIDANVGAVVRRATGLHRGIARENFVWFWMQLRELAPAIELSLFALTRTVNARRFASWGWLTAALLTVVAAGEFFNRQFVLIEAPVALLGGIGLRVALDRLPRGRGSRALLAAVFLLTFALHDYWETAQALGIVYRRVARHEPAYRESSYAALLRALRRLPHGSVFLIEESPLLYYDLGVPSPTRFPYSDHLLDPRMTLMTGVNGREELARVFALKPRFVAVEVLTSPHFDPAAVALIERHLARDYTFLEAVDARTKIYGLAESPAPRRPR